MYTAYCLSNVHLPLVQVSLVGENFHPVSCVYTIKPATLHITP